MRTKDACKKASNRFKEAARAGERRLAELVGRYFHEKHPLKPAENVAATYGVCVRTAYYWCSGRVAPPVKHLAVMVAREGARFVNKVIHPLASREADAEHITVREYLVRQRIENERRRIMDREAAELAGGPSERPRLVVRAAGAALKLVGKLSARCHREVA